MMEEQQEYYVETTEAGGFIIEASGDLEALRMLNELNELRMLNELLENSEDEIIQFYNIKLKE